MASFTKPLPYLFTKLHACLFFALTLLVALRFALLLFLVKVKIHLWFVFLWGADCEWNAIPCQMAVIPSLSRPKHIAFHSFRCSSKYRFRSGFAFIQMKDASQCGSGFSSPSGFSSGRSFWFFAWDM